jgi:uncharacterized protein involved in exopolysaccharide biosynthesis
MEKTIAFEMTESQAQSFEKLLDATLEILNRMEKDDPERGLRMNRLARKLEETEKIMERTSRRMEKWGIPLEK